MLRWFLLSLALVFCGLSLLNVIRSPDWSVWQFALVAGEYGHFFVAGPVAIGLAIIWFRAGPGAVGCVTLIVCVVASVLLLKPTFQAAGVARGLSGELDRFGAPPTSSTPFSPFRFFARSPKPVPVETLIYSGDLALDFYRAVGHPNAACVLVVHGGGWNSGDRKQLDGLNHWLAHRGYAVAAISYRLAPRYTWPAPRDDVLAALSFLKSRARLLGIDPTRLVLLGRSAGGQIAEAVAYTANDPAIRGLVGLYSPADMHFAWDFGREDDVLNSLQLLRDFLGGTPTTVPAAYDSASPYLHVRPGLPPTLLIHGQLDTLVWHRQSERLAARLTEAHVPHVFVSLPWATHAFEYNLSGPGGQLTTYALERFLARTVGGVQLD
jgi:acetyl esterase/lipase